MWESPVNVICGEMQMKMEGDILKAVQNVGVHVDREELLKALQYSNEQYDKGYNAGYLDGFNADKWIPCSERMPEKSGVYIVTEEIHSTIHGIFTIVSTREFFTQGERKFWKYCGLDKVIAWQPLPEPYEEVSYE